MGSRHFTLELAERLWVDFAAHQILEVPERARTSLTGGRVAGVRGVGRAVGTEQRSGGKMDPKVILETARHREEITAIEALMLMQVGDAILPDLLETADLLNRRLHQGAVTYVRSKRI